VIYDFTIHSYLGFIHWSLNYPRFRPLNIRLFIFKNRNQVNETSSTSLFARFDPRVSARLGTVQLCLDEWPACGCSVVGLDAIWKGSSAWRLTKQCFGLSGEWRGTRMSLGARNAVQTHYSPFKWSTAASWQLTTSAWFYFHSGTRVRISGTALPAKNGNHRSNTWAVMCIANSQRRELFSIFLPKRDDSAVCEIINFQITSPSSTATYN